MKIVAPTDDRFLDEVKQLADAHRHELGFHTRASFQESIARKELLVALDQAIVVGADKQPLACGLDGHLLQLSSAASDDVTSAPNSVTRTRIGVLTLSRLSEGSWSVLRHANRLPDQRANSDGETQHRVG
jgi:hypothetical protein